MPRRLTPRWAPSLLLAATALFAACGGGTQAELDRILAADRARQAERAAAAAVARAHRERFEAASRAALASHLTMAPHEAARWQVHGTTGARAAGLVDPDTGLCALVLQQSAGLLVFSVGHPLRVPDRDLFWILTAPSDRFGDFVQAHDDHMELYLWSLQTGCGPGFADEGGRDTAPGMVLLPDP